MKGLAGILACALVLANSDSLGAEQNEQVCTCQEAQQICDANYDADILITHAYCNKFYKCSNGQPIPHDCPSNLLYNPEEQICDWPQNVNCGDRPIFDGQVDEDCNIVVTTEHSVGNDNDNGGNADGSNQDNNNDTNQNENTCNCNPGEANSICNAQNSDGTLIAHESCNKFYKCDNGKPVAISCPSGLLYNPMDEQCDWPHNVDCGDRVIGEDEEDCDDTNDNTGENGSNSSNESGNGPSDNGSEGGTNETICNCNSDEAPSICSTEGSEGVLVAHENCNQFYKCSNGLPIALWCPGDLVYNPCSEQCDWPHNVDCGDRPIAENDDTGDAETDGNNGDGSNPGTCNCNPEEAPSICQADESDGQLIAHENCNQFYKCDHGKPVALWCPGNLAYNPYSEQCDWLHNVDCGDRPMAENEETGDAETDGNQNGNDNGASDSNNNENGNNPGTCNCNPEEAPSICQADGSDGYLIAHENCNQFYKCDHGKPVALWCPGNLAYNPYSEQCDWLHNVDCGDRPMAENEETGDAETDGNQNGNDNGASDSNNNENGNNPGTCNCNPEEAPSICQADGSDGYLIAHENCNQFYKCDHGKPVALWCPGNLAYNPYSEQCDWLHNVDCGDRPMAENEETGDAETDGNQNGNDNGASDSNNNENGNNPGTCNCNPEEAPSICQADGSDGYLIAHENCNQFYKCDHGKPVALWCPGNLAYNPYSEQCDWLHNVDCGDRPMAENEETGDAETDGNQNGNDNGASDSNNNENGNNPGTCNCNPEEAPSICQADGSDGYLIAHENCNQFYKCDHGKPVALWCPGNLAYNPYSEQCDWLHNVDCGDRPMAENEETGDAETDGNQNGNDNGASDSNNNENGNYPGTCNCNPEEAPSICQTEGSDGYLIAHENCNQFYKCDHGKPVALWCPGNLAYNPYSEQCDWPHNVDCGDRPMAENEETGDAETDGNQNGNDNGASDSNNNENGNNPGTCNCNPEEAPSICQTEGSDGYLIAHENCNQFYKCDHGKPVALWCPGNLAYNPYSEQCDWLHNVDCGDKPMAENEETGDAETDGNQNGNDNGASDNNNNENGNYPGTCNCNPGEAPSICQADGSDGYLIAHENCNQFYKCDHGKPVEFVCFGDLLYNPYKEQCDWPANVDCGDRVIPESAEDNSDSDNEGSEDNNNGNENIGAGNCDPSEAPAICSVSDSEGVLVAHENCNQFYVCNGGKPVTLTCPENLLFNPFTDQCDWAHNVDCGDRIIPDVDNTSEEDSSNDIQSNENASDPDDHLANDPDDNLTNDPDDNLANDPDDNLANDPDDNLANDPDDNLANDDGDNDNNGSNCNCRPEEAPAICAVDGSAGQLIAHENCNQFYQCALGVPVALSCPSNLLYNPYTQQCDWPENVDCGDRVIPEAGDSNDSNNDQDDSGNNDVNSESNENNNVNDDPSQAPAICADSGSDGNLVAHHNCDQFYMCSGGLPLVLSCPEGLLYNPITQQCDWPRSVDCGDRVVPETDDNTICSCNPRNAPILCAAPNSDGSLVAHENCNMFYMCANGLPVAYNCAASLFYNVDRQVCDWPQNVDCGSRLVTYSFNKHNKEIREAFRK